MASKMKEYSGKSVCGGIAVGKILVSEKGLKKTAPQRADDAEAEIRRFRTAKNKAEEQLKNLYAKAAAEVGEENAAIFEIHRMMLCDPDYISAVESRIKDQSVIAEYAAESAAEDFARIFSSMDDEYMKARAADVEDVSRRLTEVLAGREALSAKESEAAVIFAEDLAPSETLQMDKDKILAFVTSLGSTNSHTAILARTIGIPAIVSANIEISDALNGKTVVVDGYGGKIYLDPDEETLSRAAARLEADRKEDAALQAMRGRDNISSDGKRIMLYANIGNIKDLSSVMKNDAGGIGLFRSEFIYLERKSYPSEEEQFVIYKTVAETMGNKRAIIRTLDIGADKQAAYFHLEPEENPAMGVRAIRLCLSRPELFKTQLRALLRASRYGRLAIMYPMITSAEELLRIKAVSDEARDELRDAGLPFGEPEQGIMIETPAAAIISDILAPHVDFFSIGTNDLSQYCLAVDRQNQRAAEFFDPRHTSVLRMIKTTVDNAHRFGKWVGICGELAGDPELTALFLSIGVDELSVSPPNILKIRKKISEIDVEKSRGSAMKLLI